MLTLDDVRRVAATLPEVVAGERRGTLTWTVGGKVFAWERQFSKADIKRFGDEMPPPDPIVAVRTAHLAEKAALLHSNPDALFTIPHFEGFSAVLVRLDTATESWLTEVLECGWLACAPKPLVAEYDRAFPS